MIVDVGRSLENRRRGAESRDRERPESGRGRCGGMNELRAPVQLHRVLDCRPPKCGRAALRPRRQYIPMSLSRLARVRIEGALACATSPIEIITALRARC